MTLGVADQKFNLALMCLLPALQTGACCASLSSSSRRCPLLPAGQPVTDLRPGMALQRQLVAAAELQQAKEPEHEAVRPRCHSLWSARRVMPCTSGECMP